MKQPNSWISPACAPRRWRMIGSLSCWLLLLVSCSVENTADAPPPTAIVATSTAGPTPEPTAPAVPTPETASAVPSPETESAADNSSIESAQTETILYDRDGEPIFVASNADATLSEEAASGSYVQQLRRGFLDGSLYAAKHPTFEIHIGATEQERQNAFFNGGLRIYTTYDARAQALAVQARDDYASLAESAQGDIAFTLASASIQPDTGAVRALIGGPDSSRPTDDLASQASLLLGSGFDVFIFIAALEQGYVPGDRISGIAPCTSTSAPDVTISNYSGDPGRVATMTEQLAESSTCAALRLGELVGIPRVVDTANRLDLGLQVEDVGVLIGATRINPLELAVAYATIANQGVGNEPYYIERIEDASGAVLYSYEANPSRRLDTQVACLTSQTLQLAARTAAGLVEIQEQPVAGSAGTTELATGAWFAGFTPHLATAVWMGNEDNGIPIAELDGTPVSGNLPTQAWVQMTQGYHADLPPLQLPTCDEVRSGRYIRTDGD